MRRFYRFCSTFDTRAGEACLTRFQVRLDLEERQLHIVTIQLSDDHVPYRVRQKWPYCAEGACRRDEIERLDGMGADALVETIGELAQEIPLRQDVKVGLFHRATAASHGTDGPPGPVGPLVVGRRIFLRVGLAHLQLGILAIADVFQQQSFLPITDSEPCGMAQGRFGHWTSFPSVALTTHSGRARYSPADLFRRPLRKRPHGRRPAMYETDRRERCAHGSIFPAHHPWPGIRNFDRGPDWLPFPRVQHDFA